MPELRKSLEGLYNGYYRGEVVGSRPPNVKIFNHGQEFSAVGKRIGKNMKPPSAELVREFPLKIDVFDIIRFDRDSLIYRPFYERRQRLEEVVISDGFIDVVPQ